MCVCVFVSHSFLFQGWWTHLRLHCGRIPTGPIGEVTHDEFGWLEKRGGPSLPAKISRADDENTLTTAVVEVTCREKNSQPWCVRSRSVGQEDGCDGVGARSDAPKPSLGKGPHSRVDSVASASSGPLGLRHGPREAPSFQMTSRWRVIFMDTKWDCRCVNYCVV